MPCPSAPGLAALRPVEREGTYLPLPQRDQPLGGAGFFPGMEKEGGGWGVRGVPRALRAARAQMALGRLCELFLRWVWMLLV